MIGRGKRPAYRRLPGPERANVFLNRCPILRVAPDTSHSGDVSARALRPWRRCPYGVAESRDKTLTRPTESRCRRLAKRQGIPAQRRPCSPQKRSASAVRPAWEVSGPVAVCRAEWWKHERPRVDMRQAVRGARRYLVTPRVNRLFVWVDAPLLPDSATSREVFDRSVGGTRFRALRRQSPPSPLLSSYNPRRSQPFGQKKKRKRPWDLHRDASFNG